MATDDLPPEVVRFLNGHIDTVPQLEALLIIWESGAGWDARHLCSRLYLNEASAQVVMNDLHRAGLLSTTDSVTFTFDAGRAGPAQLMQDVAQTYQRNIARVATLIHNKSSSSAREFARAFDIRKER